MEVEKLTRHQRQAFERIQAFLEDPKAQVFVLRGYAGTGKTTLVGTVVEWIKSEKSEEWHCVLLASTGRAARVLTERIGYRYGASTVHKCIYRFASIDEDDAAGTQLTLRYTLRPLSVVWLLRSASFTW